MTETQTNAGARAQKEASMESIPNLAPTNVAAIDDRDPNAGGACHVYGVQFGGPSDVLKVVFQHGARGEPGSVAGIFDDDLLAIVEHRLVCFQAGPFASPHNEASLASVRAARAHLGARVADRIKRGVLGANKV